MRRILLSTIILSSVFLFNSCSILKTFQNISRLKFKMNSVNNFLLSGVTISDKQSIRDFSAVDILKLTSAVASKKLPASFTINVDALNPNDGTGGNPRTDVSLKSFPWRLVIDEKETISGNISSPISVPGVGESVIFPLTIELDLFKFFGDRDYEGLVNLALKLGGKSSTPLNIKLIAQPTVSSSFGDFKYPNELVIVHQEFR